jgi:(1->4)-alpha-D-glucan 1-alpha-D-glucosylmutase
VKLWVIREALALRARRPEAFAGAYEPLSAEAGTCAYRRGDDVVVAVPVRGDEPVFEPPPGRWRDVLDGIAAFLDGSRPALLERVDA